MQATGWTRDHARRAIRAAAARKGAARGQQRKPRERKYSYDALKYLTAVMDDSLERLVRFNELGRVASRLSDAVLGELRSMSPR